MVTAYYKTDTPENETNIGFLVRRSALLMNDHIESVFRDRGISFTQWLILKVLSGNSSLSLLELSGYVGLDPATVSRAVDRLHGLGLVARERSSVDRRAVILTLTKEGSAYVRKYSHVVLDELNWLLEGFSRSEADTLIALMQRVLTGVTAARDKRQISSKS